MGIYIKGMEMPVDCLNCKFCNTDFVEPYCRLLMRKMQIGERREDCPLTEVPPHGRCIDADELFKEMERKGWFDNADRDKAEDLVLAAPTIIPAEEGKT